MSIYGAIYVGECNVYQGIQVHQLHQLYGGELCNSGESSGSSEYNGFGSLMNMVHQLNHLEFFLAV